MQASARVYLGHLILTWISVQDTLKQLHVIFFQVAARSAPRHARPCILQALITVRTYSDPACTSTTV